DGVTHRADFLHGPSPFARPAAVFLPGGKTQGELSPGWRCSGRSASTKNKTPASGIGPAATQQSLLRLAPLAGSKRSRLQIDVVNLVPLDDFEGHGDGNLGCAGPHLGHLILPVGIDHAGRGAV